jgi:hypothetical protein
VTFVEQIVAAVAAATVLSTGASIISQQVIAARVRQRLDDAEVLNGQRHSDTVKRLERIEQKQDLTNGNVTRHTAQIEHHDEEINRLRDGKA